MTRPFIDTLRQIEAGFLLEDLAEKQRELVEAIQHTGKKGTLTITLSYVPEGQGQLSIAADLKVKAPQMARGRSLFFITPDANLDRNDPRQQELDIRLVDPDQPATLKHVGS